MNPYQILDVSPEASQEDIKKAYKKKVFQTHPDKNDGDDSKFKEVQEAYNSLMGKYQYQQDRKQYHKYSNISFDDMFRNAGFNVDDFFGDFWGRRTKREPTKPPENDRELGVNLNLTVEDIKNGKTSTITYEKSEKCNKCNGVGGKQKNKCKPCNGVGKIRHMQEVKDSVSFGTILPCKDCGGKGYILLDGCTECNEKGFKTTREDLTFEIKKIKVHKR